MTLGKRNFIFMYVLLLLPSHTSCRADKKEEEGEGKKLPLYIFLSSIQRHDKTLSDTNEWKEVAQESWEALKGRNKSGRKFREAY